MQSQIVRPEPDNTCPSIAQVAREQPLTSIVLVQGLAATLSPVFKPFLLGCTALIRMPADCRHSKSRPKATLRLAEKQTDFHRQPKMFLRNPLNSEAEKTLPRRY